MFQITRSLVAAAAAACLVVACSPADGEAGPGGNAAQVDAGYLDIVSFSDKNGAVIIGNPDASVELVEYASLTCGHCKDFHIDVLSGIKNCLLYTSPSPRD